MNLISLFLGITNNKYKLVTKFETQQQEKQTLLIMNAYK